MTVAHKTIAHKAVAHKTIAHRTTAHNLNGKQDNCSQHIFFSSFYFYFEIHSYILSVFYGDYFSLKVLCSS